ncbi:MAG TPA: hypothetical protein VKX28_32100 [Xanthobacteraceae bacterium]|nr:hypothetical protein [Xanthobacteraceae bacterium]
MSTFAPDLRLAAVPRIDSQVGFRLCAMTCLAAVFLQKLALPGTAGLLALNLFVFLAAALAAFLLAAVEINRPAFLWYAAFATAGALSLAMSRSPRVSALSLGLLLLVQLPLVFRVTSSLRPERLWRLVSTLGCVFAAVGVIQFAAQFVVGPRLAFPLDTALPDWLALKGFNSMIPLYWSSAIFKSNGVFFLEPSFFCQFLAVAVVAELLLAGRLLRLLLLMAGLISSYSGTGLTMLALFLPIYAVRHGRIQLAIAAALACLFLVFFGDALSIDAFVSRLGEFTDNQSSGWARFFSMFDVLQDVLFAKDLTLFTGQGPGTVQQSFERVSYLAFDPTWGKLLYEYGLVGTFAYLAFFYTAFCNGARGLRFAVGYTYFLLGGYLINASILMLAASLVVWLGQPISADHPNAGTVRTNP